MEEMLEKFLNTIHMDEDKINNFQGFELIKVKINNKQNLINIFLKTDRMIDTENYKELEDRVKEYFNSKVLINIENTGDKSLYLEDYYKYFLPEYIGYFSDRLKVNGNNNNYIVVYNHGEETQLNEYLDLINNKMKQLFIKY